MALLGIPLADFVCSGASTEQALTDTWNCSLTGKALPRESIHVPHCLTNAPIEHLEPTMTFIISAMPGVIPSIYDMYVACQCNGCICLKVSNAVVTVNPA